MARVDGRRAAWVGRSVAWVWCVVLVGCGDDGNAPANDDQPAQVVQTNGAEQSSPQTPQTPSTDKKPEKTVPVSISPIYRQPFTEAVVVDEIPEGAQLPPDLTLAGQSTGKLRVQVEKTWPTIPLISETTGEAIPYKVTLDTARGPVEITLNSKWAPNHVRNFITLAKLGFYDGLCFERIIHQEAEDEMGKSTRLDLVTAGCPLGVGEDGLGHIGYFMHPEFTEEVKHEAGTVGFWHGANPYTAGCRIYITLGPAPVLDGDFTIIGKVTSGLDVVRAIAAQPVKNKEFYPDNEQPKEPTIIRKATVQGGSEYNKVSVQEMD